MSSLGGAGISSLGDAGKDARFPLGMFLEKGKELNLYNAFS